MSAFTAQQRPALTIGVIGAGISGLTFAAAMRRFVPATHVTLYERDSSATSRAQGYSLGIKGETGLAVLKTLGLYEALAGEAVTISNFVFCDQRGRALLELAAAGDEKSLTQRVTRQALKGALLDAVGDTPVRFGMAATGYRQDGTGVEVRFANGDHVRADYLIAADGTASAIRQQQLGDEPRYLGLTAIVGDVPIALRHPLLEGGYFMTLGDDGSSVFCYRQRDGVHLSYTVHSASAEGLRAQAPADLLTRLQQATGAWHPPIPAVVAAMDPASITVRGYYDKEPPKRVRDGRVWLIGDAAHPMCPFQGQGANLGMVDGLELARFFAEVAADPTDQDGRAAAVEATIAARGRKAVLESRNAARQFHVRQRLQQRLRNVGLRMSNAVIKLVTRR